MVTDSNERMDESRRIEQDVYQKRKVKIPKGIFLIGRGRLGEEKNRGLLEKDAPGVCTIP